MFSTDTSKYDANDGSNLMSRKMTRRADIVLTSRVFDLQKGGGRPEASLLFDVFGQIIEDSMGFSTLV